MCTAESCSEVGEKWEFSQNQVGYVIIYHFCDNYFADKGSLLNILF